MDEENRMVVAIDFQASSSIQYLRLLHYTIHRKCYEQRNKHQTLRFGRAAKIRMKTNRCHRWMHRQRWTALLFSANQCTMLIWCFDDPIAVYVIWYLEALFRYGECKQDAPTSTDKMDSKCERERERGNKVNKHSSTVSIGYEMVGFHGNGFC